MTEIAALLIRHLLTGFGAVLVSRGLPVTSADTIVGAVSVIGGLVWSYIQKRRAAKAAQ